jgi:diguanylate cyclase (GGDEF)-like protein
MPELLAGTAAVLYVFDESRSRATAAARSSSPGAVAEEFASQDCHAIRLGHPHRVEDASKALNCGHFIGKPPDCYVCVPLSAQGEAIGMLHVQQRPAAGPAWTCSDAELNLVKAVAQHLALALANLGLVERLLERATRDNLTKLYNRHYMREWFEQELHRAGRHGRSIGVILLDIDHFKRVNDDFGHEAGDMVLREFADILRRVARRSDVACRHGGEEFLLLMPESTLEGTVAKAEELRQEVARLALAYDGRAMGSITVSAGVAMYPDHAKTADALLRRADEALYAAKEGGRNRAVVSAAPTSVPEPAESP